MKTVRYILIGLLAVVCVVLVSSLVLIIGASYCAHKEAAKELPKKANVIYFQTKS